jgi:trimeric autotransporter adhesin
MGNMIRTVISGYPSQRGLAVDKLDNLYIIESNGNYLRKFNPSTGSLVVVANTGSGNPSAVAVDFSGNIYISDNYNNNVRKLDGLSGVMTPFAGIGSAGYSGDAGLAIYARLNNPLGLAVDASGNVYIAEYNNACIRLVSGSTGIISTLVSAQSQAQAVALDGSSNLYYTYGAAYLSKIDLLTGQVTLVAGTGRTSYNGDGLPGTATNLNTPSYVTVDRYSNVYISEWFGNRVRFIPAGRPNNTVFTLIGNGNQGYGGDGRDRKYATLNSAGGLVVDSQFNVYVIDFFNNAVRMTSSE